MSTVANPLQNLMTSNLYARYSGLLTLSDVSLILVDQNGDILLEFIPSPDFCTYLCRERENQVCLEYRRRFASKHEGSFTCKNGLENIILPIRVQNEIVGYIAGMQVYSPETEHLKYMIDLHALKEKRQADLEFIAKCISSLKTLEPNKIKIHEQLCSHIAKNISMDMSESMSHSNQDNSRFSIEKEILEKKIIDLEAKNMSLVINPHFLFNTLNCIARIAYFENSHTTEELIYCLSDLLRYNLKQEDQLHTLGSEIDNIEKYLYIQKVRFKSRLEYEIQIHESLMSYRIPNMVIQPIVENAVIHGITPKRDGGKISIQAEERDKMIVILISDNGNGFPKETLEGLHNPENKAGLGFRSTNNRLKRYYGEPYGLDIIKSDFSGSTVSITIPTQPVGR